MWPQIINSSQLTIEIFPRLLGIVYFWVFLALAREGLGLYGKEGISPLATFSKYLKRDYFRFPSLYWLSHSDRTILLSLWSGLLLSILLMLGIFPFVTLLLLFFLHLSIVTWGQEFMSFGWEALFLEISFYTLFLIVSPAPNLLIWWNLNFLLFRFMFEAGISKFEAGDPNWKNLTAVKYHYLSQPLPNTQAWYFYQFPMWLHKLSCLFMLIVEIGVPFLIFGTAEMRILCFVLFAFLQISIWFTGNFSYLNLMTLVFSFILLPLPGQLNVNPIWADALLYPLGAIFLLFQVMRSALHFKRIRLFETILSPFRYWRLFNRYGLFAVMTIKRYEVTLEGSEDGENWKEYHFKWKPSEPGRRPRRVSPYQPRLDWQAWFLPFSSYKQNPWFERFLTRLLEGSPHVVSLLRDFPNTPPKYIRANFFEYTFTNWKEKKETGNWWKRTFAGDFSPTYTLKEPHG